MAIHFSGGLPPFVWWFLLPATVWVIYTLDHLFDALYTRNDTRSIRHLKHHENSKLLLFLVILIAPAIPVISFLTFETQVFLFGSTLGFLSGLHLLAAYALKDRYYPKEPIIALLYAAGVWFVPALSSENLKLNFFISFLLIFLAALLNLLLFSYMDHDVDLADGQNSISTQFGKRNVRKLIYLFTTPGLFLLLLLFINHTDDFLSVSILFILNVFPSIAAYFDEYFILNNRYRIIGDSLFLLNFFPYIFDVLQRTQGL